MSGKMMWKDDYSVGVEKIDGQHRAIIVLCNDLQEAIQRGGGADAVGAILERMVDHANEHFTLEESYLKEHCEFDAHRQEHWNFIKKVMRFCGVIGSDQQAVSMEVYDYLVQWLDRHLREMDVNYFHDMALEKSPA